MVIIGYEFDMSLVLANLVVTGLLAFISVCIYSYFVYYRLVFNVWSNLKNVLRLQNILIG